MTTDTPAGSAQDAARDEQHATASPELIALAEAHGVATAYWSFFGDHVQVPASTLRAVLTAMGVDTASEEAIGRARAAADEAPWRRLLPPSVVVRHGGGDVWVHVADGYDVQVSVVLEDGSHWELPIPAQQSEAREIDGSTRWRVHVPLPSGIPLGWHTLRAREWRHDGGAGRTGEATLIVTPHTLAPPPTRSGGRGWGLMAQLYSVRSRASWGIGDFADLADISAIAGAQGADFVLINPIHAAEVAPPIEPSPYLPATRRYVTPLYVRPEDIREAAYLHSGDRVRLAMARSSVDDANTDPDRLDRDAAWAAKKEALQIIFAAPRTPARQAAFDAFVDRHGQSLYDFALWCALEEHFAATLPEGQARPAEAWDRGSDLVATLAVGLADRISFYTWLQWVADEQVAHAHETARTSGMAIGVMHDLAVGVHPRGADVWSLREMYARGITVGAPPDMYNQQGQDWSQPPWLPHALAEAGYRPLREMIANLLRHAGALRIDHIIGLFRLWWIPEDLGPAAGTYVRYDHEAMIGVLALEAHRAGAVVIGEDLGNVEPWVREYLSSRGVLGTSVLWFEHENGGPMPPEHYRRGLLAAVNTHDLPPTAGYLAGEHVDLRDRLGLLTRPAEDERADAAAERDVMLQVLRQRGLIGDDPTERQIIEALHVHLAASPSQLLGVNLVDAVGERRSQNVPGTHFEYPNWQVPLADGAGRAVLVEDLPVDARFLGLTAAVERALHG